MQHSFLDKYAYLDSPVHRLTALSKIIISLELLLLILAVPADTLGGWIYTSLAVFLGLLVIIARVPALFVIKRLLVILPFIILIIIFLPLMQKGGLKMVGFTSIRAILSILVIIILTSTTRFSDLLKGLGILKVPKIIIMLLSFIYRYFFILTDEIAEMLRSVSLRAPKMKKLQKLRIISRLVGHLFVHSYERSERIYQAMVMRGFDGTIK
jgi:cobalt/nickel transport system permease protein